MTFPLCFLVSGVAANAKVGSELIKVLALDNDIGNNSLVQYHIVTIRYFQSQSNGSEDVGSIFTIGELPYVQHSGRFKTSIQNLDTLQVKFKILARSTCYLRCI